MLILMMFIGIFSFKNDFTREVTAAKAIYVPINYTSIQTAIDNANPGDTIYVWAGTYYENLVVDKTVSLVGNGTGETVIDGGNNNVSIIKITANWVNVTGFYTKNSGSKSSFPYPAGIELNDVENVSIYDNNCSNNCVGILLIESNNNKIFNNTCFYNEKYNIYIYQSNSNSFKNNTCNFCQYGILIYYGEYNLFESNTCSNNYLPGILISYSNYNTIINSICNSNSWGIYSQYSSYNTISKNQLFENYYAGIVLLYSDLTTTTDNIINSTWVAGLTLYYSTYIKLKGNELQGCSVYMDGDELEYWNTHTIPTSNKIDGKSVYYYKNQTQVTVPNNAGQIILANCTKFQIINQHLKEGIRNIMVAFSNLNTISNNFLINTTYGMFIYYSDNNTFHNNSILYGNKSFRLFYSSNNIIENNTANYDLDNGLYIESGNGNQIKNNDFNLNANCGFSILSSNNNLFMNNNLSRNRVGVYIRSSYNNKLCRNGFSINNEYGIILNSSNHNRIYHNDFLNNPVQADIDNESKNNYWDNNEKEGNYWSDYDGLDNGANNRTANDGIGDTEIPHLALDHYPFINLSGWLQVGIPILYDPGDYSSNGSFYIGWYPARGANNYVMEEDDNLDFDSPITIYEGLEVGYNVISRNNGTYYYRLKAMGEESESPWSNVVDMIVDWPPEKPKILNVAVYPKGNALNISWDGSAEDVNTYELYYKSEKMSNWELLTTLVHPNHKYDHIGLIDGIKYEYKVQAIDFRVQISGFSDIKSGIPKDSVAPSAPNGLSIVEVTNDSIKLTWDQNPEADVAGYNIYQFTTADPSSWGELRGTVEAGIEEFLDKDLSELTTYYYVINTFDEVFNNSTYSDMVFGTTSLGPHGPEINQSVQDFSIYEDNIETSKINLYHWFKDINNDPLDFWCEGDKYINVTIFQNNGTVMLKPIKNWNGNETLVFYAFDGYDNVFDSVTVTVLPVNDPPNKPSIIEPKSQLEIDEGTLLNFTGECTDPDQPEDIMTFKWTSDIQGDLGFGKKLIDVELIPGVHNIVLTVYDENGTSSTTNITVTVIKSEPLKTEDNKNTGWIGIAAGITIIIIFLLLLFVFLFKKCQEKSKSSTTPESASSRFSFLSYRVSTPSTKDQGKIEPQITTQQPQQKLQPPPQQKMESALPKIKK